VTLERKPRERLTASFWKRLALSLQVMLRLS
jgi:hypothetical protein